MRPLATATHNLIELLVWGRKSRAYRRIVGGMPRRKQARIYLVLNERAWLRLSGKLFKELPRDEAISVLNTIKQYAK
jgi:hypothetical protein